MATSKYRRERRAKYHAIILVAKQMVELFDQDPNAAVKMGYAVYGELFKNSLVRFVFKLSIRTAFQLAVARCTEKRIQQIREEQHE